MTSKFGWLQAPATIPQRPQLDFGLPNLLRGQSATFSTMRHLVGYIMREGGKLLGGLHPGRQCDLLTVG